MSFPRRGRLPSLRAAEEDLVPLHRLARDGDVEAVRAEVERLTRAGLVAGRERGWTAAQTAALHGHAEVVVELSSAPAAVVGEWHQRVDNARMIEEACGLHSSRPLPEAVGGSPLALAALRGHAGAVRALLEAGTGGEVNAGAGAEGTPLYFAIRGAHEETARLLLEHGADAAAVNHNGITALAPASYFGLEAMVELLMEGGADPNVAGIDGVNALILAAQRGHVGVARALLNAGAYQNAAEFVDRITPLIVAVQNGHEPVARLLLDRGADVHASFSDGVTSLYMAAQLGSPGLARLLLEVGANPEACRACGMGPLYAASRGGRTEVVRALLEHGANPSGPPGGLAPPPLWAACRYGHPAVAVLLAEAGADPNAGYERTSPLAVAMMSSMPAVVRALVLCGARLPPGVLSRCRSALDAETLLAFGGVGATEADARSAGIEARAYILAWLEGATEVQQRRRAVEESALAARGDDMPLDVAAILGDYVCSRTVRREK